MREYHQLIDIVSELADVGEVESGMYEVWNMAGKALRPVRIYSDKECKFQVLYQAVDDDGRKRYVFTVTEVTGAEFELDSHVLSKYNGECVAAELGIFACYSRVREGEIYQVCFKRGKKNLPELMTEMFGWDMGKRYWTPKTDIGLPFW